MLSMERVDCILKEVIEKIIVSCVPLGHLDSTPEEAVKAGDLGLGFLYYAMSRTLKPDNVVLIGSYRGFSVICFALGLLHNGKGILHFIDSSQVDGFWTDQERVKEHFSQFGVKKHIRLYNTSTQSCLENIPLFSAGVPFIDILFVDGDHSLTGISFDYIKFGALVKERGIICLHDSFVGGIGKTAWQVAEFLSGLKVALYESLLIEVAKGLTIIKKVKNRLVDSEHIQKRVNIKRAFDTFQEELSITNHAWAQIQVNELQSLFSDVMMDIADYERTLEIRYRYLTQSNKTMLEQIAHLKKENKRLQAVLNSK